MLVLLLLSILISSVVAQSGHPEFDEPMETIVLLEGLSQQIGCFAKGELPMNYTWYDQNDEEISFRNASLFATRFENGSFLVFLHANLSHAGLYSCSATNRHGTATKTYDIIVNATRDNVTTNEPPGIVSTEVMNVTESSVEFDVETKGDPDSFYIRYKEALDSKEEWIEIRKWNKALVEDLLPSGLYQFWIQTEHPLGNSSAFNAITLNVTMLPDVPEVIFWNVRDGSVEVEWVTSTDDSYRDTIQEYELSYNMVQRVGGRSWHIDNCVITVKIPKHYCFPARHTIAGLQKDQHYEIRLRVRTKAGFGKPYVNKVRVN